MPDPQSALRNASSSNVARSSKLTVSFKQWKPLRFEILCLFYPNVSPPYKYSYYDYSPVSIKIVIKCSLINQHNPFWIPFRCVYYCEKIGIIFYYIQSNPTMSSLDKVLVLLKTSLWLGTGLFRI